MNQSRFISYAQNREDVLLHRALKHIDNGTYVEVGANHPELLSVTKSFSDRGWSGLLVEPNPEYAEMLRLNRERDIVEESVMSDHQGSITLHVFEGTGLSTVVDRIGSGHEASGRKVTNIEVESKLLSSVLSAHGFDDRDIHFMSIDTEGAEAAVLGGLDLGRHRPWILVIESTLPLTTEQVHQEWESGVLSSDYQFCLFDGLSRYYVAAEHAEMLAPALSYPVCVFDEFDTSETVAAAARAAALDVTVSQLARELDTLESALASTRAEINRMALTFSWKVTAPLRAARRVIHRGDWARKNR